MMKWVNEDEDLLVETCLSLVRFVKTFEIMIPVSIVLFFPFCQEHAQVLLVLAGITNYQTAHSVLHRKWHQVRNTRYLSTTNWYLRLFLTSFNLDCWYWKRAMKGTFLSHTFGVSVTRLLVFLVKDDLASIRLPWFANRVLTGIAFHGSWQCYPCVCCPPLNMKNILCKVCVSSFKANIQTLIHKNSF